MSRKTLALAALASCVALTGCLDIPDYRPGAPRTGWGGTSSPAAGPAAPSTSLAESACMAAGRDAGFDVRGVTGTREVVNDAGIAVSRDVMLNVSRGGQSLDVRCSFAYDTASARIMTL
ncbi:MAG: hypothetical protein H6900_14785 [Rhodobacter sp.]|uniref:hypothetical protein n=1 Tax=Pararhodobacter sp. TaxID=2127056 RepID=UPI001DF1397F|nr:hypothetical protein [Pararhodobacter sp.]MCB1346693.1 hypothetical protein [Paracoccaceae bacterium]MCC0074548.1 hypothetical protein [Rhodobacter sp.]HPD91768.1 hypothetical protein [Pararhodobacter sp.]